MATTFQEREQAFESRFARDQEFRFRVQARRDKLFARWAAAELGLAADAGAELVTAILAIADGPGHDAALLRHVAGVFSAHRHAAAMDDLSAALQRCARQAQEQLMANTQDGAATR